MREILMPAVLALLIASAFLPYDCAEAKANPPTALGASLPHLTYCQRVRPMVAPGQDTIDADAWGCWWGRRWCWVTVDGIRASVTWCEP